jgi:Methyltransferase domain
MLNWAARYYPIVRVLKSHGLFHDASLLEIGSGSVGIGRFRQIPFVGCDISFPIPPAWPMTAITASATQLPMKDKEFDVVVASDMLEHVPPDLRATVIGECLRVARKLVIFGFPCGPLAWQADQALFKSYVDAQSTPPEWLAEHMEAPFPDTDSIPEVDGWKTQRIGNESIRFHSWMMEKEKSIRFIHASQLAMRFAPSLVEAFLRKADRSPFYRQIFVFSRRDDS